MKDNISRKNLFEDFKQLYAKELKENLLPFWESRCLDTIHGGYYNCFTNDGRTLVSKDKYTWSQGRFVWIWAKLAMLKSDIFSDEDRRRFLSHAKLGIDFLRQHALLAPNDWRCVFLNDEAGNPKFPEGQTVLNGSIYADCFVILAFSKYALAADDPVCYTFAKKLYLSAMDQLEAGTFHTLPYPLSQQYRAHGIPMIFDDVSKELYYAALHFAPEDAESIKQRMENFVSDILTHFVDSEDRLHEIISSKDQSFLQNLLGQHLNPGHTLEDTWFILDAAKILGRADWEKQAARLAKRALSLGWDPEYGGLYHFCGVDGGEPIGSITGVESEPMLQQTLSGWSDKLWWVHSEALYATLRLFAMTDDTAFLEWHNRVLSYVQNRHLNPDRSVGEWIQILKRDGTPQQKVTALPVKDPYHIIRNVALLIELCEAQITK